MNLGVDYAKRVTSGKLGDRVSCRVRIRQHFYGREQTGKSAFADHHTDEHPDSDWSFQVKWSGNGRGFVRRHCMEHVLVRSLQPELNKRIEGYGIARLH